MTQSHQGAESRTAIPEDPWGLRARDWAEIEDENSRELFETVHDATGVRGGTRLLDVGCGSGLACATAAARGAEVSGMDASPGLVALAKERLPQADLRVGEMGSLPYEDDSFDVLTFVNTFFFAADRERTLREARRVTRPGGKVAVVMWTAPERVELSAYVAALQPLIPAGPPVEPFIETAELEALARAAGLEPQTTFETDWSWDYPDRDTMLRGLLSPGLSALAVENVGEETVKDALIAALEPYATTAGGYRLENSVRCMVAASVRAAERLAAS
jgi:SAM-dependent methyltransferase